jgi:hypothetical protein
VHPLNFLAFPEAWNMDVMAGAVASSYDDINDGSLAKG